VPTLTRERFLRTTVHRRIGHRGAGPARRRDRGEDQPRHQRQSRARTEAGDDQEDRLPVRTSARRRISRSSSPTRMARGPMVAKIAHVEDRIGAAARTKMDFILRKVPPRVGPRTTDRYRHRRAARSSRWSRQLAAEAQSSTWRRLLVRLCRDPPASRQVGISTAVSGARRSRRGDPPSVARAKAAFTRKTSCACETHAEAASSNGHTISVTHPR